uniref:interleukin-32 isoform X2 n=1 Tax=Halichoerus grypus TaxID=9711 RepID=UPI00165950B4|nr:interleukin-32 isoform X2 [Halichoerus grypus]
MCFTQVSREGRSLTETLKPRMHQMVDSFFNKHQHQPEGQEQEQVALLQLEADFDEALLDAAMDLHDQNSSQILRKVGRPQPGAKT